MEQAAANAEFALAGEEEGWVATHQDPSSTAAGSSAGGQASAAGGAGAAAPGGDDDIPDLNELELNAAADEVGT
jgi:hypothetical protein